MLAIYAGAVHDLYLASSAALGRSDERLFAIVDRAYARYLLYDPRGATSDPVRVAHAALLAADGHRDAAAEEYARVAPSTPDPVPDPLRAHYFAVLGDTERALHWLRLARERDPGWSSRRIQLRVANDLDALRDDPRFVELLGPDE